MLMLKFQTSLEDQLLICSKERYVSFKVISFKIKLYENKMMEMNLLKNWGWVISQNFYQFVYDEKDRVDTNIIQYFIMHGL